LDVIEKDSPCKVNLLLNVLGKRLDGFHEVETLIHPINFCDQIRCERAAQGVQLSCSDPNLPTDAGNLVYRAAAVFLQAAGIREGVHIYLHKRIPQAAGLGGGSGNGATTLLALNELFGQPLGADRLYQLAAALGADVPFFLQARPALATGRGERIEPLDFFPALREAVFLLVYPGFGIATAWAYQQLARFPEALKGQPGRAAQLAALLRSGDLRQAAAAFYNALEAPAFAKYPILALYQDFLRANGAVATLMSGSGSTTFAILEDHAAARQLEQKLRAKFGACWTAVVPAWPSP
jgi:4-diphosphocytidyl-2-C-methyl-D-erythritol kinase